MEKVSRLTPKQKDCLRLVAQNMNSKQIARTLGISEHTVDQRVRQALRVLDVTDRFQAAQRLARAEGAATYQPLIHQPEALAESPPQPLSDDRAEPRHRRWPEEWFPSLGGNRHDLNRFEILMTIVRFAMVIAGGSAAVVAIGLWLMRLFASP